jgi:hypothetical protein
MKAIAKVDFTMGGKKYIAGDEIDTKNIKVISMLNEKGFIEPLTYKDLVIFERELTKKKNEL